MDLKNTLPEPGSLVDFSRALEARVQWALATYACDPDIAGAEYGAKMECAEHLAWEAGWTFPTAPTPHLFSDVPYLRDIFERAAADSREELAEFEVQREAEKLHAERKAERLRARERINALLAANDWQALDLPTPEALTATLLDGKSETISGHFVDYDSDDGLTWYTNPYGVDGVLYNGRPTAEGMRVFLVDMAYGRQYGPSPD